MGAGEAAQLGVGNRRDDAVAGLAPGEGRGEERSAAAAAAMNKDRIELGTLGFGWLAHAPWRR